MKKWYFSDNGNVTGPFSVNDAKSLLSKNSDLYGWNPTFSQWLPVIQISELSSFISESKPAAQIPKELIDKFVTKKRDLNKKINLIDDVIKKTQINMSLFEKEINKYKNLTESLTTEVQDNIVPIDKKYQVMSKQLRELNKATEIAKQEIIDVVQEFGELVLSKTSDETDDILELNNLPTLKKVVRDEKIVQIKETSVQTTVRSNVENQSEIKNTAVNNIVTDDKITNKDKVVVLKEQKDVNSVEKTPSVAKTSIEPKKSVENKKTFGDVKNRLKSVFKHKVEKPPMIFSEQLKALDKKLEEELVYIDSDINEDDLIDDEPKKKRMKPRKFY